MAAAPKRESATKKHIDFTDNSMKGKPVTKVPGIADTSRGLLEKHHYTEATQLYGQYLKDPQGFRSWLIKTIGMGSKDAGMCVKAFEEWSQRFL